MGLQFVFRQESDLQPFAIASGCPLFLLWICARIRFGTVHKLHQVTASFFRYFGPWVCMFMSCFLSDERTRDLYYGVSSTRFILVIDASSLGYLLPSLFWL